MNKPNRSCVIRLAGEREPFEAGDLMFIAAGTEHHFEDFTEDLAVWVVFYGPAGGEVPA
jgi:mannose-6-phosphate isomerase-like protein (cupin superfamily)